MHDKLPRDAVRSPDMSRQRIALAGQPNKAKRKQNTLVTDYSACVRAFVRGKPPAQWWASGPAPTARRSPPLTERSARLLPLAALVLELDRRGVHSRHACRRTALVHLVPRTFEGTVDHKVRDPRPRDVADPPEKGFSP